MDGVFGFDFESQGLRVYSYSHDVGLLAHGSYHDVGQRTFVFLVNAPADVSMQVVGHFSYVFFLDAEPVERDFLAQNYQLVYSQTHNCSFQNWVETVIRYLCAALRCNGIPGFDVHDVASVLLEVQQHRLLFELVSFDDPLLASTDVDQRRFNRLLAVAFTPPDWGIGIAFEKLEHCEHFARRVAGGGAFHPYQEGLVMLLGDALDCDKPSTTIKNKLSAAEPMAIYE